MVSLFSHPACEGYTIFLSHKERVRVMVPWVVVSANAFNPNT